MNVKFSFFTSSSNYFNSGEMYEEVTMHFENLTHILATYMWRNAGIKLMTISES